MKSRLKAGDDSEADSDESQSSIRALPTVAALSGLLASIVPGAEPSKDDRRMTTVSETVGENNATCNK